MGGRDFPGAALLTQSAHDRVTGPHEGHTEVRSLPQETQSTCFWWLSQGPPGRLQTAPNTGGTLNRGLCHGQAGVPLRGWIFGGAPGAAGVLLAWVIDAPSLGGRMWLSPAPHALHGYPLRTPRLAASAQYFVLLFIQFRTWAGGGVPAIEASHPHVCLVSRKGPLQAGEGWHEPRAGRLQRGSCRRGKDLDFCSRGTSN